MSEQRQIETYPGGGPPPFSLQTLLFLGTTMIVMFGALVYIVLPVARRIRAEGRQTTQYAGRGPQSVPDSESIWKRPLDASRSGDIWHNRRDGYQLLQVPAGRFEMGVQRIRAARPRHRVSLSEFHIGRYVVTVAQYRLFLEAGAALHTDCHLREPPGKDHTPAGWSAQRSADLPVVGVDWFDAYAYAAWAGLRLPTECEWERAAGGMDGRRYPWGATPISSKTVWHGKSGPTAVEALAAGDSPVGSRQMIGNVWEWCYDLYDANYYSRSPSTDPKGPAAGSNRVVRGGSYRSGTESWDVRYRHWRSPLTRAADLGFRCAR